jgi:hypothetical protein
VNCCPVDSRVQALMNITAILMSRIMYELRVSLNSPVKKVKGVYKGIIYG